MASELYPKIYALPTPAGILHVIGQQGPVELQMDDCTGENAPLAHAFDLYIPVATLEAGASYTLQFSEAPVLSYEPTLTGGRYTSTAKNTRFGISVSDHSKRNGNFELVGENEAPDYALEWNTPRTGDVTVKISPYARPETVIHIAVAWGDASSVNEARLNHFLGAPTE